VHEDRLLLGGDFYGVVPQDDASVDIVIGDVSGHGSTAAAVGTTLRAAWRGLMMAGTDLETAVAALNQLMHVERRRNDVDLFTTACLAHIDSSTGAVSFVLAGHPPPLLLIDGERHHAEAVRHRRERLGAMRRNVGREQEHLVESERLASHGGR